MSFPRDILVVGIGLADLLTAGVQGSITHEAYTSGDGNGDESWGTPTAVSCVIDQTHKQRATSSGRLITIVATLTFPRGGLLIDPRDKITLPDGTTGPLILDSPESVIDPVTGRGFITTVQIGEIGARIGS